MFDAFFSLMYNGINAIIQGRTRGAQSSRWTL